MNRAVLLFSLASPLLACSAPAPAPVAPSAAPHAVAPASSDGHEDAELATVAAIHGGAGPWVVAGYRMGEYAMKQLGLDRYSFDLEVQHHTPHKVQYSCIADGAAAATGASLGS
jgi:formylmethanofuran dehydrogenase subunit E